MNEIEKYARAAASTARTPPNSPARHAAIEAENTARVAAEQFVKGLEAERDELRARLDALERQELAALAAGITGFVETADRTPCHSLWINSDVGGGFYWDPHKCTGSAARLAVRLDLQVKFLPGCVVAIPPLAHDSPASTQHDGTEPDKLRAWREAVVLCAAAVGDRMKGGA